MFEEIVEKENIEAKDDDDYGDEGIIFVVNLRKWIEPMLKVRVGM